MQFITTNNPATTAAADTPQPQPSTQLTPEAVVEQLRAIRSQIAEVTPLTPDQRRQLRYLAAMPREVVESTINLMDFSAPVQQVLGKPSSDVRDLQQTTSRWSAVEDELNSLYEAISGANFVRRHQLALITAQAYSIGAQLVRDPANAELLPHVREIKKLRTLAAGRKKASAPQAPQQGPVKPMP
jgi:chemotaxis regulatin CheY-phosphate phosphatase CheZ